MIRAISCDISEELCDICGVIWDIWREIGRVSYPLLAVGSVGALHEGWAGEEERELNLPGTEYGLRVVREREG